MASVQIVHIYIYVHLICINVLLPDFVILLFLPSFFSSRGGGEVVHVKIGGSDLIRIVDQPFTHGRTVTLFVPSLTPFRRDLSYVSELRIQINCSMLSTSMLVLLTLC